MSRNRVSSRFIPNVTRKTLGVALVMLVGGAAAAAHAQSPADRFIDSFANLQGLSSDSPAFQRDRPAANAAPVERVARLSFRDLQALSSDSPAWQPGYGKVDLDRGPTFAQSHPHGLSFAEYQAYASDTFALPPGIDTSTMTATAPATKPRRNATTTVR